jgi:hypothetical protein
MTSGWRGWALTAGVLLAVCGIALWANGGGWMLLIVGAVVIVTVLLEPVYGRATNRPVGGNWRATDEKFVDPESGKLLTVWFDPATGDRRYVEDASADHS